jgi:uncharacterized damage-inducible protein DinB
MKTKKITAAILSAAAACLMLACTKPAATTTEAPATTTRVNGMIADWERAKKFTIAYLDSADDKSVDFKLSKNTPRSFGGQLLHLAEANYGLGAAGAGTPSPVAFGSLTGDQAPKSKADVTKAVLDSYDFVLTALKGFNDKQLNDTISVELFPGFKPSLTREQWFNKTFEHQTHHRGQATQYLRAQGKTPPEEMLF